MLKPHYYCEILKNEKLFQLIQKQVFPENLFTALKGTLHLYYQLQCKQECHSTTEGADEPSGEARAFEYTAEAKQDNVVGLSSFHPVTLDYEHLLVESHRCLRGKHLQKAGQTPEHTLEILSKLTHGCIAAASF